MVKLISKEKDINRYTGYFDHHSYDQPYTVYRFINNNIRMVCHISYLDIFKCEHLSDIINIDYQNFIKNIV